MNKEKLLKRKKNIVFDSFIALMNEDETFVASVTSSTGDKTKVIYRYTTIENLIKKVLQS